MSNNKQQTAVEWLVKQLQSNIDIRWRGTNIIELVEQAKEMEKEQIIYARNDGFTASEEGWNGEYGIEDFSSLTKEIKSEQYYNETYGGNK